MARIEFENGVKGFPLEGKVCSHWAVKNNNGVVLYISEEHSEVEVSRVSKTYEDLEDGKIFNSVFLSKEGAYSVLLEGQIVKKAHGATDKYKH